MQKRFFIIFNNPEIINGSQFIKKGLRKDGKKYRKEGSNKDKQCPFFYDDILFKNPRKIECYQKNWIDKDKNIRSNGIKLSQSRITMSEIYEKFHKIIAPLRFYHTKFWDFPHFYCLEKQNNSLLYLFFVLVARSFFLLNIIIWSAPLISRINLAKFIS